MKIFCCNTIGIISALLCGLAIFSYFYIPKKLEKTARAKMVLANGSELYKGWLKGQIGKKFYIFHMNNTEKFKGGEKPFMIEKGPFSFRKDFKHKIEKIEDHLITYRELETFYFEKDKSKGSLDEIISFLDMFLLGAIEGTYSQKDNLTESDFETKLLYLNILRGQVNADITQRRSIRDILYGFQIPLLQKLTILGQDTGLPNNTFGILYMKNNSYESNGIRTIDDGVRDPENLGKIYSWNGKRKLNVWSGNCNKLKGTDGSVYPPNVEKHQDITIFVPDLCRSLRFDFERNGKYGKVPIRTYKPCKDFLNNRGPNNECYCVKKESEYCKMDGILDLSSCKNGIPVYVSAPHFYKASAKLRLDVDGMKPEEKLHNSFIELDEIIGTIMNLSMKIQINFEYQPRSGLNLTNHNKPIILPIFWTEITYESTKEIEDELYKKLHFPMEIINNVSLVSAIAFGSISVISFLFMIYFELRKSYEFKINGQR